MYKLKVHLRLNLVHACHVMYFKHHVMYLNFVTKIARMPLYKRVSNRGETPVSVLEQAAAAVQEGTSLRFAAISFKCDRMTY